MNKDNRPANMSQLDYLWTYFGDYSVSNIPSDNPAQTILTQEAVNNLIQESLTNYKGVVKFAYRNHPTNVNLVQLVGYDTDGKEITSVDMPKEVHVANFGDHIVTSEDIDLGCPFEIGTNVILLEETNGTRYYFNVDKYRTNVKGSETDTINTEVKEGVISSKLKVKKTSSVVSIHSDSSGIYTRINVDTSGSTGVALNKDNGQLSASIPFKGTNKVVRFEQCSLSAYLNSTPIDGTVYFLTDTPYIYLDGVRYGLEIAPEDSPIVSITYNPKNYKLEYRMANQVTGEVVIGPASREYTGVLSAEDYSRFDDAYNALTWNDINN